MKRKKKKKNKWKKKKTMEPNHGHDKQRERVNERVRGGWRERGDSLKVLNSIKSGGERESYRIY